MAKYRMVPKRQCKTVMVRERVPEGGGRRERPVRPRGDGPPMVVDCMYGVADEQGRCPPKPRDWRPVREMPAEGEVAAQEPWRLSRQNNLIALLDAIYNRMNAPADARRYPGAMRR